MEIILVQASHKGNKPDTFHYHIHSTISKTIAKYGLYRQLKTITCTYIVYMCVIYHFHTSNSKERRTPLTQTWSYSHNNLYITKIVSLYENNCIWQNWIQSKYLTDKRYRVYWDGYVCVGGCSYSLSALLINFSGSEPMADVLWVPFLLLRSIWESGFVPHLQGPLWEKCNFWLIAQLIPHVWCFELLNQINMTFTINSFTFQNLYFSSTYLFTYVI